MYPKAALLADPMDNVQTGIDPIVTRLVQGIPFKRRLPSTLIFRNIEVDSWNFQWNKFGSEAWYDIDTERAMRAEITSSEMEVTQLPGNLRRFSHKMKRDEDEIKNANPSLRLRELLASQARFKVMMNIERIKKTLLTTTTNYPVTHRLAIAGGSEWDSAGGDSRSDIRAIAEVIAADTGVSLEDVNVFLSEDSKNAALSDPIFLGARQNFDTDTPDLGALQRYWGVGPVVSANPIEVTQAGVISSMYSDVAILWVPNDLGSEWDTEYGEYDFVVDFKWSRGSALEFWFDRNTTTWNFPWQDYSSPKIINNNLGGIITNTKS